MNDGLSGYSRKAAIYCGITLARHNQKLTTWVWYFTLHDVYFASCYLTDML